MSLAPKVSLVQVNAPIMPGNSGGPVVDFFGNVIGINSFCVYWHGQTYAFCIAASEIQRAASSLDKQPTPLYAPKEPVPSDMRSLKDGPHLQ